MKQRKKIGSVLCAFMVCLMAICNVAQAGNSASTEVQIQIEASQPSDVEQGGVQTGDDSASILYIVAAIVTAGVIVILLRRKGKGKGMIAIFAMFCSLILIDSSAYAAESDKNVSVTIPSGISVSFEDSGSNRVSDFTVRNQSLVPITLDRVSVTEKNEWKLATAEETIPVNTKKLVFSIENACLQAGENALSVEINEQTERKLDVGIKRGAWTTGKEAETALMLEFEYAIGQKAFQLNFDSNGSSETVKVMQVLNGASVALPVIARAGYALVGWQDAEGNVHNGSYVMPIGNVTLKAVWAKTSAYAVYSADDNSLCFYQSPTAIKVGSKYNGKTVTAVYTGFETAEYSADTKIPWYAYREKVQSVVVVDEITPVSMAFWFVYFRQCSYFDVAKINTKNVTDMKQLFSLAGQNATSFKVIGMKNWNVSKVTRMNAMFNAAGKSATTFYIDDISGWDVSNVTNMSTMFVNTGLNASWKLDLSKWNVKKVTAYNRFNANTETKVIAPKWVN